MKKNVFKFAYIALALVSMIALSNARADDSGGGGTVPVDGACAACGTTEGSCLKSCLANKTDCYACQTAYVNCEVANGC